MELAKTGKIRLNKLAFFVEFGYIFKTGKPLSDAEYAGIDMGPVINDYKQILARMEKAGDIKIDGNRVIPLKTPRTIPDQVQSIIDPLIKRFDAQTDRMLVNSSHTTDAYKITTKDERVMGKVIDKNLANLETAFFDEKSVDDTPMEIPIVKREKLVPYEFG